MDDLIASFNRASIDNFNSSIYNLFIQDGGVFTDSSIPASAFIGKIDGAPMYIWEITHPEYLIISDDCVLDVSGMSPRPILTWIREDNQTYGPVNCYIEITDNTEVLLFSQRFIAPGEELVYKIIDRLY